MSDIDVACRCGGVAGRVRASPGTGIHAVCYCNDCQAFARFLGTDGILDAHGGSDIYQVAPASLELLTGTKNLACVRLSDRGMHRWFASCCRTPIGNTASAKIPFIGLVQPFMQHAGASRDGAIGPPRVHVHTASAIDGAPPGAKGIGLGAAIHFARFLLGGWLGGKGRPNPLYDDDGTPRVVPEVLSPAAREALTIRF